MTFLSFFYRMMAGVMGGMFGTLFIFLVYSASLFFIPPTENPITNFVLILMIFLGSLTANLLVGVLASLASPEKYTEKNAMLWHAFLLNMFLFLVSFPFYMLLKDISVVAVLELVISAIFTNIILEMFAYKKKYILTGLYGSLFAGFLILVILTLFKDATALFQSLLFTILPLTWLIVSLCTLFIEIAYMAFYRVTGTPVLDIDAVTEHT